MTFFPGQPGKPAPER